MQEYVPDLKELKSRQNLYNKRKCVWLEVQRYMSAEGLSEDAAISRLQEDVHVFGRGLSRYIDTVLRERQKQRRGAQLLMQSISAGGSMGDHADAASEDMPESASVKRPRVDVPVEVSVDTPAAVDAPTAPPSPRVAHAPLTVVTPVRLPPAGLPFATDTGLKTLGSAEERAAQCGAATATT